MGCLEADVAADAQVLNVVPLYVKGKTHLDPMVVATSAKGRPSIPGKVR